MKTPDVLIYHKGCADGWACAVIVGRRFPTAFQVAWRYGEPIPEGLDGMRVLMADVCFSREEMEALDARAASLDVFDHHKTAEAALDGFIPKNGAVVFDMARCGAQITWDELYPGVTRPWWVDYTADRDLWTWELPESEAVNAYLMALPRTHEQWDAFLPEALPRDVEGKPVEVGARVPVKSVAVAAPATLGAPEVAPLGASIRLHIEQYVRHVADEAQPGVWGTESVRVVNAAYPNISDACSHLLLDRPEITVAVGWFERGDGQMQFSLRSRPGGPDVSALAKTQGGGGHPHAAGFQLSWSAGRAFVDTLLGRALDKSAEQVKAA